MWHKYHNVAEMCPNHKIATTFRSEICGEFFKKPHKMKKIHNFHKFFLNLWSSKPLIFKEKMPFSTNTHFSKSFWGNFFQKDILPLKCGDWVKIDYYPLIPTKIASTLLKPKMWKMWKSAITNTFLILKMWQDLCSRNHDWECNDFGNKYDDRRRLLG